MRHLAAVTFVVLGTTALAQGPKTPGKAELEGRAYLGRNRPVVGAAVVVRPEDDRPLVWMTSTDRRGEFKLVGLDNGDYEIEVTRSGLEPVIKDDVSVRFPFRSVVDLLMAQRPALPAGDPPNDPAKTERTTNGGSFDLTTAVSRQDGTPLPDVQLRLTHVDAADDPRAVRSGADGAVTLEALAPGTWRLDAWGVGYLPIRRDLRLDEDTRLELVLVRQPAEYEPSPFELMPEEEPIPPEGLDLGAGP